MALATVAQLKEYLGVTGTSDDALLTRVLAAAETFFYTMLQRNSLEVGAFTQTLDGTGKDYVMVSYWPIVTLTSLVVAGETIAASLYTFGSRGAFDSRMVYFTSASGLLFPKGRRNVVVSGTAGYATTPPDVQQAVVELAGRGYQKRKRLDEVSKQVGGETVSYSTKDLTDFASKVVNVYGNRIPL